MKRISLIVAIGLALLSQPMGAQERLGSGTPDQTFRAGWTFTPTIGVGAPDPNRSWARIGAVSSAIPATTIAETRFMRVTLR